MSDREDILVFLKKIELFKDFSESELNLLLPFIERAVFEKGAYIFKEGEEGKRLCILRKGRVEIIKEENEIEHYRLAELGPGEWVGEMALFDAFKRTASVRALEKTEVVFLSFADLNVLSQEKISYSKIALHLGKTISKRLKSTNEIAVKSLKEQLRFTEIHDTMGRLIIYLFFLLALLFFTFKIFNQYSPHSVIFRIISCLLTVAIAVTAILLVVRSGYPLKFYGVTAKNWRGAVVDAIMWTIPILVLMVIFKWIMIHSWPEFKDLPLTHFGHLKRPWLYFFSAKEQNFAILITIYILLVPLQEFIARGCLQSCFEVFFKKPHNVILAILASNLLFALFHGLQPFSFIAVTFIMGLFWGWLYHRQKTLVGVSVSHMLVAFFAFVILDYDKILIF
jgi:CRP-like cAMP-binding protein